VFLLGAVATFSAFSILCASAADTASLTQYTTALFTPEVQVSTQVWRRKGALLPPWPTGVTPSSPTNDLLHNLLSRFNPDIESLDVTLSYKLTDVVFLSGGGRFLLDRGSGSLKPWPAKVGVNFQSPWMFLNRSVQSVSSAEFRFREDHEWSTDFSVRAGLRWSDAGAPNRSLSFMLECFTGESRSRQGYQQRIDYIGLGLHYWW
jgi:Protein of unknown function (DUF1207)